VIRLSDDKKPPGRKRDGERQTGLVLDERTRTKKPPMYKVLLHNDDYTTREFVVWVLQSVFPKNESHATALMSHVHNNGRGGAARGPPTGARPRPTGPASRAGTRSRWPRRRSPRRWRSRRRSSFPSSCRSSPPKTSDRDRVRRVASSPKSRAVARLPYPRE